MIIAERSKQLRVHQPLSKRYILCALKPIKIRLLVEVVNKGFLLILLKLFEVVTRWQLVQELIQDAEEHVSHLDSELFIRVDQILLIHLMECRVKLCALEVLQCGK